MSHHVNTQKFAAFGQIARADFDIQLPCNSVRKYPYNFKRTRIKLTLQFLHRKLIAINYDVGKNILLSIFSILFTENSKSLHSGELLRRGQEIKVIGTSSKRGFLIAQIGSGTMHVPFQLTELKTVRL